MMWQRILGWCCIALGIGSASAASQSYSQGATTFSVTVIAVAAASIWAGWMLLRRHPRRTL